LLTVAKFCLKHYVVQQYEVESKQLEDDYCQFPALTSVGYKFLGDPFTNDKQLSYPKMCENPKMCEKSKMCENLKMCESLKFCQSSSPPVH